MPACPDPDGSLVAATAMAEALAASHNTNKEPHAQALYKDCWTGDLIPPPSTVDESGPLAATAVDDGLRNQRPRSARLPRSPKERTAKPDEDTDKQAVWMVQNGSEERGVGKEGDRRGNT